MWMCKELKIELKNMTKVYYLIILYIVYHLIILYYQIAKNVHAIAEIKTIVHLLVVAWKRALFTELILLRKVKHTYIMAHLMENSSIGTTITQIRLGITVMKTKLNSQTYLAVKTLWDWVQSKMEYCCVCYTIQVYHKKMMWPLSNREVHNSTS